MQEPTVSLAKLTFPTLPTAPRKVLGPSKRNSFVTSDNPETNIVYMSVLVRLHVLKQEVILTLHKPIQKFSTSVVGGSAAVEGTHQRAEPWSDLNEALLPPVHGRRYILYLRKEHAPMADVFLLQAGKVVTREARGEFCAVRETEPESTFAYTPPVSGNVKLECTRLGWAYGGCKIG